MCQAFTRETTRETIGHTSFWDVERSWGAGREPTSFAVYVLLLFELFHCALMYYFLNNETLGGLKPAGNLG